MKPLLPAIVVFQKLNMHNFKFDAELLFKMLPTEIKSHTWILKEKYRHYPDLC